MPGTGGLFDALLVSAGARNVERGAFGFYDVETLVAKNPNALVIGDGYSGAASLRDDQNLHPVLLHRYAGRRIVLDTLYGCGVPESSQAALQLQAALERLPKP